MRRPASMFGARWRDALLTGNGELGAAVFGGVLHESIVLTNARLWTGARTAALPDVSANLERQRRLLLAGEFAAAERVLTDALRSAGYDARTAIPEQLGELRIGMPSERAFRDYERELDLASGVATVGWRDGETRLRREVFVSRARDLVVARISADGPMGISATIGFGPLGFDARPSHGDRRHVVATPEARTNGGYLTYTARTSDGTDFGAVIRVVGHTTSSPESASVLTADAPDHLLVLVGVFINEPPATASARLHSELAAIDLDYDAMLDEHVAEHRRLFGPVQLELDDGRDDRSTDELLDEAYRGAAPAVLVEKLWAFGRYLFVSSTRPGGPPCGLMGIWCGEGDGFWAFHMANINMQMIHWHALAGDLAELMQPFFDYHDAKLDDYRENARQLFGCRGIYVPADTTGESGLLKDIQPHIVHFTAAAGWLAQHYADYYRYTGDVEFLRTRALPFLREVGLFYEDFVVHDEAGTAAFLPSNSPENAPLGDDGRPRQEQITVSATIDVAVAREVLTNLIDLATQQGMYADEVHRWSALRATLPAYRLTDEGAVAEWIPVGTADNEVHRHHSHLYGLFPGREVQPESQLAAAFEIAARHRLERGLAAQTSWSLVSLAHVFARLGDGERALECLDIVTRLAMLPNLLTMHNDWRGMVGLGEPDWAPFQIDANIGWTSAVQEMLLGWDGESVRLLPALPARWTRGRVTGLRCPGGLSVSLTWDQPSRRVSVALTASAPGTVRLRCPRPVEVLTSSGRAARVLPVSVQAAGVPATRGRDILVEVDASEHVTLDLLLAAPGS
ncbi:MAG: glycosyl hydrolase family 95 catalytic domain-containing protein [Jatrophihabitans sp.]|uniref:glycosyl hydrolase family 95 catalytic domain-containing protein n=1 Tax=Jatrophihabitans sp. TaxID=1932789 RepID=UPI003F7D6917